MFKTLAKNTFYIVGSYAILNSLVLARTLNRHPEVIDTEKMLKYAFWDSFDDGEKVLLKLHLIDEPFDR